MITLGKKPTLANRRLAFDRLRDRDIVVKLFDELGPRYAGATGRLPAHPEDRLPRGRQRADGAASSWSTARSRSKRRPDPKNKKEEAQEERRRRVKPRLSRKRRGRAGAAFFVC